MALKAAGAGYAGGQPDAFLRMPVDWAMDIIHYLRFQDDWQTTFAAMNEERAKK